MSCGVIFVFDFVFVFFFIKKKNVLGIYLGSIWSPKEYSSRGPLKEKKLVIVSISVC